MNTQMENVTHLEIYYPQISCHTIHCKKERNVVNEASHCSLSSGTQPAISLHILRRTVAKTIRVHRKAIVVWVHHVCVSLVHSIMACNSVGFVLSSFVRGSITTFSSSFTSSQKSNLLGVQLLGNDT